MHFGLSGRHEHIQMLWGDVKLKKNSSGNGYLELNERISKTRQGGTQSSRAFPPKIYATGTKIKLILFDVALLI